MSQIVVRLPRKLDQLLCSFPFLENLRHFYEAHEIHLICDKVLAKYLVLLPFNAFIHGFDEKEYPGALDIPRYVAHQENITDVSKFYSLTNSKIDAAFGKAFNAKETIGFKFGITANLLFNKKINYDEKNHPMTQYLAMMEGNLKKDGQYFSRELECIVQELYRPYVVISIKHDDERLRLDPKWCDYINYYHKYTIYIISENAPAGKMKELTDRYKLNTDRENRVMFFECDDAVKLCQLIYHAKGFVTDESDLAYVASYMSVPTIEVTEKLNNASPLSKAYKNFDPGAFMPQLMYDESHHMFNL